MNEYDILNYVLYSHIHMYFDALDLFTYRYDTPIHLHMCVSNWVVIS